MSLCALSTKRLPDEHAIFKQYRVEPGRHDFVAGRHWQRANVGSIGILGVGHSPGCSRAQPRVIGLPRRPCHPRVLTLARLRRHIPVLR